MGKYSLWVVLLLHVVFDRGQWALTRYFGSCVEAETGFPSTFTFSANVKYVSENVTRVTAETRHGTGPKTLSSAAKRSDDDFALSDVTPLKQTTSEEEQSLTTTTRVRFSETLYNDDRVDIAVTISKSSSRRRLQSDAILIWSRYLFLVLDPVVTAVGTAGNLVMLVALRRQSLRHNPVSAFMTGLAVADTMVLLLDFLNNWVYMVTKFHIKSTSMAFCRAYNWLFSTMFTYSAWLVVAMAMERFLVVWFPLRAKRLCNPKTSAVVAGLLLPLVAVLRLYNLFVWDLNKGRCDISHRYEYFNRYVKGWLDATFYSYVPLAFLVFTSAGIAIKLAHARSERIKLGQVALSAFTYDLKVAKTVLAICVAFFLLTVPLTLYYVIAYASDQFVVMTSAMELAQTVILLLALCNHAISCFVYGLTCQNFRREIKNIVSCKWCKKSTDKYDIEPNLSTSELHAGENEISMYQKCNI